MHFICYAGTKPGSIFSILYAKKKRFFNNYIMYTVYSHTNKIKLKSKINFCKLKNQLHTPFLLHYEYALITHDVHSHY